MPHAKVNTKAAIAAKSHRKAARRDTVVSVRLPSAARDLIDEAASLTGKTRTQFMVDSASREARDAIAEQRLFDLDAVDYDAFLAALDTAPPPLPSLQALLAGPAPWDKSV